MKERKQIIGYTTGVFDLFHVGHLNMLTNAKALCDKLIVGVSTDELVLEYKNKKPVIPFADRKKIVENIKCVDMVISQSSMDKLEACRKLNADIVIVGDDWYGSEKWNSFEKQFRKELIEVFYIPYTEGISSTILRGSVKNILKEENEKK